VTSVYKKLAFLDMISFVFSLQMELNFKLIEAFDVRNELSIELSCTRSTASSKVFLLNVIDMSVYVETKLLA